MLIPGGSSGGIQDVYCQFTSLVSLLSKAVSVEIQCYSSSAILHRDREFLEDPTRIVDAIGQVSVANFEGASCV